MNEILTGDGKQANPTCGYIMGYFTESPERLANAFALHLASSRDGRNWRPLHAGQPVLVPEIGECGMRDPFIFRKQDGQYIVVATNMWNSESIMCYDSPDLIHFEAGRLLRLNSSGMHAWAPEIIYDPERQQYAIFWSGNTERNRIYVNYTQDFLSVTEAEVFFDPGYDVIDASIIPHGDMYFLYFKDERNPDEAPFEGKRIKGAVASSLQPGSFNKAVYTRPIGEPMIEGPFVIRSLDEDKWYLYGDCYTPINAKFFVWETSELNSGNWQPMDRRNYQLPPNAKHVSILSVNEAEWSRLIQTYEPPIWFRIRSYALPDYYLRADDSFAKLAPIPFDPYTSSLWKVTRGLASPDGVSIESVHQPGFYLRSSQFVLRLSKLEDSDNFREECTFMRMEGLSETSWSSFRSFSYPDMYLIVDGAYIRISIIECERDKAYATFQLG